MKRTILIGMILLSLVTAGCGSRLGSAGVGAVGGAAAGAGGYEWKLKSEMNRIEDDYREGRIDRREYEIRKDQIERLSILR
jgi:hypothetical protein